MSMHCFCNNSQHSRAEFWEQKAWTSFHSLFNQRVPEHWFPLNQELNVFPPIQAAIVILKWKNKAWALGCWCKQSLPNGESISYVSVLEAWGLGTPLDRLGRLAVSGSDVACRLFWLTDTVVIIFLNFWAFKRGVCPPAYHSLRSPSLGHPRPALLIYVPCLDRTDVWVRDFPVWEMIDGRWTGTLTSSYLLYFPLSVFILTPCIYDSHISQEREMEVGTHGRHHNLAGWKQQVWPELPRG